MSYLKPQTPIQLNENYIYPLTTADQVILNNGNRLNSLFKKTIKETATLQVANWSDTLPYTQTITLTESTDDYNVDANIAYSGNESDTELNKAAGCISYIKKNHKEITFYCLKEKPMINIPVEITGTCRNTIATVEEGIKLNFDIVGNPRPKTGDTLYWDGNTEGLEVFSLPMSNAALYKVSDVVPTLDDFSKGAYYYYIDYDTEDYISAEETFDLGGAINLGMTVGLIVYDEEQVLASKGTYLFATNNGHYISSLTIPGFTGFEKDDIEVKENTIWVDTDVPITGYKFSATEPEDMIEGEVWIKTGVDSDVAFDIVEGIKTYPLFVKQYVSDIWVEKTAKTYQGGEWVDWWNGELFDNGKQYETVTGGWTPDGYTFCESKYTLVGPKIFDTIDLTITGALKASISGTANKINLSEYNQIAMTVDKAYSAHMEVRESKTGVGKNGVTQKYWMAAGENQLDISSLSGEYYVVIFSYATEGVSGTNTTTFSKIKLVK